MNDTLIRWGGSRAVVSLSLKIIVILLLVGGEPLLAFWPFGKTHAPTVEVYDEANVLQDDGTASSLENLRFRKDVKLVVVTLDAGYNDNFNSAIKKRIQFIGTTVGYKIIIVIFVIYTF